MGFIIFVATSTAFLVAAVISLGIGAIGVIMFLWRGRGSTRVKRAFWYVLISSMLIGVIIINVIQFPQAPMGSNYEEWLNEWVIKAVVYALIPGVACFLGGAASIFTQMIEQ